jgi:rubredoxin
MVHNMPGYHKEVTMDKWQCQSCDYVYSPDVGDPDNEIEVGTKFEDLPKKWACPECGAKKNKFQPYDEEEESERTEEEEE